MKPAQFSYYDPRTVEEVLQFLDEKQDDVVLLAGGQSLVPMLNMRLAQPECVVDLGRVAGLYQVEDTNDSIALGSMVTLAAIERNAARGKGRPEGLGDHSSLAAHRSGHGSRCRGGPVLPPVRAIQGAGRLAGAKRLRLRELILRRGVSTTTRKRTSWVDNTAPQGAGTGHSRWQVGSVLASSLEVLSTRDCPRTPLLGPSGACGSWTIA
ncbi:FAD binding domain-containing protein [Rhodococcus qingshengii]|jgi:hypothetical protein|uniref:FAD binding domain-containing protein n=1 Tax=Actinomycetes TaxID=1760 RepID=UPI0009EE7CE4